VPLLSLFLIKNLPGKSSTPESQAASCHSNHRSHILESKGLQQPSVAFEILNIQNMSIGISQKSENRTILKMVLGYS
jgi:hypothetical protein